MTKKKRALLPIDLSNYITEDALDAIRSLEGHYNGAEKTADVVTTYYGMTQRGIDSIKRLEEYGYEVPKWMKNAKVDKITEEQARQMAGYLAAYHTEVIDDRIKNGAFRNLDLRTKSALLTYFHNTGVFGLLQSLNDEGSPIHSTMSQIRDGDKYDIARSLLYRADGTKISGGNNVNKGARNRALATISLMFDDTADFSTPEGKDAMYNRYNTTPGYVNNMDNALQMLGGYEKTWQADSIQIGKNLKASGAITPSEMAQTATQSDSSATPSTPTAENTKETLLGRITNNFASFIRNLINNPTEGSANENANNNGRMQ